MPLTVPLRQHAPWLSQRDVRLQLPPPQPSPQPAVPLPEPVQSGMALRVLVFTPAPLPLLTAGNTHLAGFLCLCSMFLKLLCRVLYRQCATTQLAVTTSAVIPLS